MRSFLWFCPLRGQVWTGGPWGRQDRPFALRSPSSTVANGGLRAGHLWSLPWPAKPSCGLCGLTVQLAAACIPVFFLVSPHLPVAVSPYSVDNRLTLLCRQPTLISFQSSFTRLADAQQVSVAGCSAWAGWSDFMGSSSAFASLLVWESKYLGWPKRRQWGKLMEVGCVSFLELSKIFETLVQSSFCVYEDATDWSHLLVWGLWLFLFWG